MTTQGNKDEQRVALLIDADNADPALRTEIEGRARKYGRIVRRLGFGRGLSRMWKEGRPALEWPTRDGESAGRNAADIDLAFTAGELLHTDDIDCFCIASGDSDFAGLARRLRDADKKVIGIGEPAKTAKAFRDACDEFAAWPRLASRSASPLSMACAPCTVDQGACCSALRSTTPSSATALTATLGCGTSRSTAPTAPPASSCTAAFPVACSGPSQAAAIGCGSTTQYSGCTVPRYG